MDPWSISPVERQRHGEQFASCQPVNGFINGGQAKGFFMQSGLQPMVLAQIWGLADINGDGQMDMNEFSIACKLITNKLKGFELPAVLPPSIMMAPAVQPQMAPIMAAPNPMMHQMQQQHMMQMQPGMQPGMMMAGAPAAGMTMTSTGGIPVSGLHMVSTAQPMGMMGQPVVASVPMSIAGHPMAAGVTVVSSAAAPVAVHPAVAAVPVSAAVGHLDWAIPQQTRAKYSAVFAQTDRARTGFLAGVQARNILVQSGLAQNVLAQIWALSDVDNDGKLSTEEFILSGHLCDLAAKGEPMPATLPPNLIPPSMRKRGMALPVGPGSDTVSTPGSIHGSAIGSESPSTFEDKRRENFNKGQAELEKRRQSLVDQQKKEEEEKKKKEQEAAEQREKQKAEMERQRLMEWEKQRKEELTAHRQREQDKLLQLKAKQDNMNADLEALREKVKTLTANIGDSRTGVSDVKTFIDGMRSSRDTKMKEMNDLKTKLKDQNQRLLDVTQEKAQLESKNKARAAAIEAADGEENPELTEFEYKKIEKEKEVVLLRENFEAVKEKEASTRDRYDNVKAQLQLHREDLEKVIESCKALYDHFDEKRREIKAEKSKRIRELTDPDHAWGSEDTLEGADGAADAAGATAVAAGSGDAGDVVRYVALYDYPGASADELSFKVGDIILVSSNQNADPGWLGGEFEGKVGWFPEAYAEREDASAAAAATLAADSVAPEAAVSADAPAAVDAMLPVTVETGKVLFDWSNPDGTFKMEQGQEVEVWRTDVDGWSLGRVNGQNGFYPSSFVSSDPSATALETAPEMPDEACTLTMDDVYVAAFKFEPAEDGDLAIEPGDVVTVIKKGDEWWTGTMGGGRSGVFPYNYVEPLTIASLTAPVAATSEVSAAINGNQEPVAAAEAVVTEAASPIADAAHVDNAVTTATVSAEADAAPAPAAATAASLEPGNTGTLTTPSGKKSKKKKKDDDSKKKMELAKVVAPYEATSKEQLTLTKGQMILVRKKTDSGWWQGEIQGGDKGKKRATGWFPASYVKLLEKGAGGGDSGAAASGAGQARAIYPYSGSQDDELSFEAGDVINIVNKDKEDWWSGELNGKTGVFPANHVEPI